MLVLAGKMVAVFIACAALWGGGSHALEGLRASRLLTCRDVARVRLLFDPAVDVVLAVAYLRIGAGPFALFVVSYTGTRWFIRETLPFWRAHRHHDEDCEFGPKRHPFRGRRPKLVAFAAPEPLLAPA